MSTTGILDHCSPAWVGAVRSELEELLTRKPDWDGRGGVPPTMETATDAFNVVSAVQCGACPMPSFALDPSGLIEVSWSGDGIKIEIEVDGSGDAEVFQRCPGFAEVDRPVTIASGDFRFVAAALTRISK